MELIQEAKGKRTKGKGGREIEKSKNNAHATSNLTMSSLLTGRELIRHPASCNPPQQASATRNNDDNDRTFINVDHHEEEGQQRQTTAVKQIMAQCVAKQSSDKYAGQNAGFAMFCFDSIELRDCLLEQWFITEISEIEQAFYRKRHAKECCLKKLF